MSTVTSCTLLSGRPATVALGNSSGGRLLQSGKAAAVALPCFQRRSRPFSVCFANNSKGEHGPKTDLAPFNISPVALVHPVPSPREERWEIEEKAHAVNMWFEVPGLSKEDLVVEIDEDVLVIRKKPNAEQQLDIDVLEQQRAANRYRAGRETTTVTTGAGAGGAAASYKASSRDVTLASAASRVDRSKASADAAAAAAHGGGGVYARLLVPAGYSRECVEAELASGVLRVTIGKVKENVRRRINVDIHVK